MKYLNQMLPKHFMDIRRRLKHHRKVF